MREILINSLKDAEKMTVRVEGWLKKKSKRYTHGSI